MDWRGTKAQVEAIETAIRSTGCYSVAKDKPENLELFGEYFELRKFTRILEVYPSPKIMTILKTKGPVKNWEDALRVVSAFLDDLLLKDMPVVYVSFHYDERTDYEEWDRLNSVRMTLQDADAICNIVPELPGLMCDLRRWDRDKRTWETFPKVITQEG